MIKTQTPTLKPAARIPGPDPAPVLGWRANMFRAYTDPIGYLSALRAEYGEVVQFVKGGMRPILAGSAGQDATLVVVAFGPENNRQIMANADQFHTGPIIGALYPQHDVGERRAVLRRLGTGLFGVHGEEHRRQRRLVMPMFHKQHIGSYHDQMLALTQEMLAGWQPGQRVNMAAELKRLTMLIAGRCLLGVDFHEEAEDLAHILETWLKLIVKPAVLMAPYDIPGMPYHRMLNVSHRLDAHMQAVVRERRDAEDQAQNVLSMLFDARYEDDTALTDEEILGHTMIFFAAGHETTANALMWTLFLLSQHPAVMAALHAELEAVLGGAPATPEALGELPFLESVIKESMRILPVVPMSGRTVHEPVELDGYALEPGTEVYFSHYHTHHDPALYAEPERFDPWRWEHIAPTAYEYMPFSVGIRSCIGAPFALMEMRIILATILQRYRLEAVPDTRLDLHIDITMSAKQGLPLIVRDHDGRFERGRGAVRGDIHRLVALPSGTDA